MEREEGPAQAGWGRGRSGEGAGSSPGGVGKGAGVGEGRGAAQAGGGGAGSSPGGVEGLPSLHGRGRSVKPKQVRAIGAGGVHLEFAEGRRSGQNRAEKRGRTAPWRGLEAVSPLDLTPWAAESTAGGSQRESSMLRGGQVAETGAAAPEAGQESTAVAQAAGRPWAAEWGP